MLRDKLPKSVLPAIRASFDDETVLAAVSGGPDSMAMFHALCTYARERSGLRVIAAHFDHRLRADSSRDVETVERVAAEFDTRVVRGSGDVRAHASASRQSIEAAARELRYAFLEQAAEEVGADEIATAHTFDDHIETLVMRIARGTGTRGMRGIPWRRGSIVRPLLSVAREETLRYCDENRVPFVTDPTNDDVRFFRNRVRHEVLPALRRAYPGIDGMLERMSTSARTLFDEAELSIVGRLALLRREHEAWILPRESFSELNDLQRVSLLMRVLDLIHTSENVLRTHYSALLTLVLQNRPGLSVDLPGIRVRLEHDALVFAHRKPGDERRDDMLALPLGSAVQFGHWNFAARRARPDEARAELATRDTLVAFVPATHGLTVRFPRPGDRMQPFGMSGHKKLSDLFIDMKIPRRMRVETPVIESNGEIVWVVGVAASECTRIDHASEDLVRLSATRRGGDA